eukprot:5678534-Prymnesium_polylepis.3
MGVGRVHGSAPFSPTAGQASQRPCSAGLLLRGIPAYSRAHPMRVEVHLRSTAHLHDHPPAACSTMIGDAVDQGSLRHAAKRGHVSCSRKRALARGAPNPGRTRHGRKVATWSKS